MTFGFFNIIWVWLKEIVKFPANLAKVASINKDLKIQQELSETQQRLEKAEQQLAKYVAIEAGRMFFGGNVIWAKNADGEIEKTPYCPRCFELDGKAIHLIVDDRRAHRTGKCLVCKGADILIEEP